MLDNHVVDQTYLKVLPTETWDLCLLCLKNKLKIKIKFQGCIYIKCNRYIYKTASKLSKFCIAIVYFCYIRVKFSVFSLFLSY